MLVAAALEFNASGVKIMTALVVLWSVHLTFNLARKGGFRPGNGDYRWAVIREKLEPLGFAALNITFISFGQMLLVWLLTAPVDLAGSWSETPLGWLDVLATGLFAAAGVGAEGLPEGIKKRKGSGRKAHRECVVLRSVLDRLDGPTNERRPTVTRVPCTGECPAGRPACAGPPPRATFGDLSRAVRR